MDTREQILQALKPINGMVKVKTKKDLQCGIYYPKWKVYSVPIETAVEWIYYGLAIVPEKS